MRIQLAAERDLEQEQIARFGRFRYLVAKHFLSKSLDQLAQDLASQSNFTIRMASRLVIFNTVLDRVFPENRPRIKSLGAKFETKDKLDGLYRNHFAREANTLHYRASRAEAMTRDIQRMQANQCYLNDMNEIFRPFVQKQIFYDIIRKR